MRVVDSIGFGIQITGVALPDPSGCLPQTLPTASDRTSLPLPHALIPDQLPSGHADNTVMVGVRLAWPAIGCARPPATIGSRPVRRIAARSGSASWR